MQFNFDQQQTGQSPNNASSQSSFLVQDRSNQYGRVRRNMPTDYAQVQIEPQRRRRSTSTTTSKLNYVDPPKKRGKRRVRTTSQSRGFRLTGIKILWLLCLVGCMRLVFMDRGVMDFYSKKDLLNNMQNELENLRVENSDLVEELELIRSNPAYQKKLAREHLGVIAKDEYLILFAQEASRNSI